MQKLTTWGVKGQPIIKVVGQTSPSPGPSVSSSARGRKKDTNVTEDRALFAALNKGEKVTRTPRQVDKFDEAKKGIMNTTLHNASFAYFHNNYNLVM